MNWQCIKAEGISSNDWICTTQVLSTVSVTPGALIVALVATHSSRYDSKALSIIPLKVTLVLSKQVRFRLWMVKLHLQKTFISSLIDLYTISCAGSVWDRLIHFIWPGDNHVTMVTLPLALTWMIEGPIRGHNWIVNINSGVCKWCMIIKLNEFMGWIYELSYIKSM